MRANNSCFSMLCTATSNHGLPLPCNKPCVELDIGLLIEQLGGLHLR